MIPLETKPITLTTEPKSQSVSSFIEIKFTQKERERERDVSSHWQRLEKLGEEHAEEESSREKFNLPVVGPIRTTHKSSKAHRYRLEPTDGGHHSVIECGSDFTGGLGTSPCPLFHSLSVSVRTHWRDGGWIRRERTR